MRQALSMCACDSSLRRNDKLRVLIVTELYMMCNGGCETVQPELNHLESNFYWLNRLVEVLDPYLDVN